MIEEAPLAQLYVRVTATFSVLPKVPKFFVNTAGTLIRMVIMQTMGWQIYLFSDVSGSPRHPKGTNVRVFNQSDPHLFYFFLFIRFSPHSISFRHLPSLPLILPFTHSYFFLTSVSSL
jgi:hypothetical protein